MRNAAIVLIAAIVFAAMPAVTHAQSGESVSSAVFSRVVQKISTATKDKAEVYGQVGAGDDPDAITMDGKIADFTTVLNTTKIGQTQNAFHIMAGTQAYAVRACINETIGNSIGEDKSRTVLIKVDAKGSVLLYVETRLDAELNTVTLKRYDAKNPKRTFGYQKGDAEKVFVLLSQSGKYQIKHFEEIGHKGTTN